MTKRNSNQDAGKGESETEATRQPMVKHIKLWLIDRLIPLARNPRTHSEAQIAQIGASIAEFGFNNPILVDTQAGIIAGHGRLLAARKLGLTEVPVIVLDHLSETQKRAYIIADNQLALNAGWDEDLLRVELAALQAEDFNIDLIGFDDRDLAQLMADQDVDDQANLVPEAPAIPVTVPGDLWLCGKNRVLCGDSTDGAVVSRLLAGKRPFLMITDPPYGIELDSEWRDRAGLNGCGPAEASYMKRTAGHTETSISGDTRADWSDAFALVPSLEVAYVFHASKFTHEVLDGLLRIGFLHHQQIIPTRKTGRQNGHEAAPGSLRRLAKTSVGVRAARYRRWARAMPPWIGRANEWESPPSPRLDGEHKNNEGVCQAAPAAGRTTGPGGRELGGTARVSASRSCTSAHENAADFSGAASRAERHDHT